MNGIGGGVMLAIGWQPAASVGRVGPVRGGRKE